MVDEDTGVWAPAKLVPPGPFLWLDESLKHLDPRNRRITASLMSAAGRPVLQILVTTYEVARRPAAAASAEPRQGRTPEIYEQV